MSFFRCRRCHCKEDTALCNYWSARLKQSPAVCSACDPKIAKWHGNEFDRAYMDQMVAGHKKAANLLKSAQNRESAPQDIKDFAKNTLSGVTEHLKLAADLDKDVDAQKPTPVTQKKSQKKEQAKTH